MKKTKVCYVCKKRRMIASFYKKNGKAKNECIQCQKKYMKEYRIKNKERLKEYSIKSHADYYQKNTEKVKAAVKKYRKENPDKVKTFRAIWREENREDINEKHKEWREENKEHVNERSRQWKKENRYKVLANTRKRQAGKQQRTPKWAIEDIIKVFYFMSEHLGRIMNEKYHVDHIIPLKGENITGLHTHNNLQVITAKENMTKNNKIKLSS